MNIYILIGALISIFIGIIPLFLVKRDWKVILIAGGAYILAIVGKAIIQLAFLSFFLTPQIPTYIAYGILTTILEPGFAYLFSRFIKENPETYGIGLAFWENAIFLGLLELPNAFIETTTTVLPLLYVLVIKIMDRTSSLFIHYSWGVSAYYSFWRKELKYIFAVAPLGMVDSLVAYVDLTHSSNYFIIAIPSIIVGIAGFLLIKYYFKLS
ncbi:hypothetical protein [Acidianus ambivalens]|uniref:YhfC family intramembrane metalloprotease n=1 Tax=Acidianus ambivalens TaxID=2283 RepID=A0A650CV86_ACIAM|nr:hypothetical protein [Acidianus ambivalens]MQL55750.1 hypothetical protein [Acidianus ambivalens]QGR21678.1 hypothetical protein D1866_06480 [Acidianus ambivalens]